MRAAEVAGLAVAGCCAAYAVASYALLGELRRELGALRLEVAALSSSVDEEGKAASAASPEAEKVAETAAATEKEVVRQAYAAVARGEGACCVAPSQKYGLMGYKPEDKASGLGCGNPVVLAAPQPGETIVDLGCGAGGDALLAAAAVGACGRVIGVDMTTEMIEQAWEAADEAGVLNVDFKLGSIEKLPVESGIADCIISNCVINLSPDKAAVCREMFRALKPGGRVAVSDVVAMGDLPEHLRTNEALTCWVAGAPRPADLASMLEAAGFEAVVVEEKPQSAEYIKDWLPGSGCEKYVVSAAVTATKPKPVATKPAGPRAPTPCWR